MSPETEPSQLVVVGDELVQKGGVVVRDRDIERRRHAVREGRVGEAGDGDVRDDLDAQGVLVKRVHAAGRGRQVVWLVKHM